ncbi:MAG: hypothetical protein DRH93_06565 [Deltaproteobacteria bacterium]|nr:MAG: hypothetical protein DRH93_06565 [Deltaproteobacteria bacterium]
MMRKKTIYLILFAMVISLLPVLPAVAKIDLVTLTDRESVQTTIYNKADLTLVRDKRVLNFVKGMNLLQFSWANTKIDPTSLSLEMKKESDKIDVVDITYPPGAKDVGIWRIKADQACRVPVEITYFTSGISWKSYYIALLSEDQKTCSLKGYVKVTNLSGEDYNNAQTRLVVGKINILDKISHLASLQYPYGRPEHISAESDLRNIYKKGMRKLDAAQPMMAMESAMAAPKPKAIQKQGLSEYFLYTIEGTETIPNGWTKRLLSFKADTVKVNNIYKYEADRFGENVVRFSTFTNTLENNLGETPLPGGEIKVFHSIDKNGKLAFVGSDTTKYIPVEKKAELNLGNTSNVKIIPKVMAYAKKNIIFDNKGNVSGFDEVKTYEIQLSNFTGMSSTIEYTKNLDSSHFNISAMSHPDEFEKTDQDTIKFTIHLSPNSHQSIGFTLTTLRGERRWQQ